MILSSPAGRRMVDARSLQDYGKARIGNATFISPENVREEGRLKPGAGLKDTFARLNASRTTVVYSDDIYGAPVVWFAMQLTGFDAISLQSAQLRQHPLNQ